MKKVIALIISLPLLLLGAEWQSLNGPPLGRADDMTIGKHLGQYYIYAADQTHKLYKSENEGELWEVPTDDERVDNPTCVITEPNYARVVYIGKNDATPVWKSNNWGETWDPKSTGITNTNPRCFAMHPNYSNKIYLGCEVSSGQPVMFKTTDGGADWSSLTNFPNVRVKDIAIAADPRRGTTILAGCSDGIYRSIDGGNNWTQTLSDVICSAVAFANQFLEDIVYAGGSNGVYKSTDGGVNWQLLDGSPGVRTIAMVNVNTIYVGTSNGVYLTTDGGVNWELKNGAGEDKIFSKDIQKMLVHPDDQNQIFASAALAVYKTTNGGDTWSEITKGFKVSDFESNTFDYVDKKADYNDVSVSSQ